MTNMWDKFSKEEEEEEGEALQKKRNMSHIKTKRGRKTETEPKVQTEGSSGILKYIFLFG